MSLIIKKKKKTYIKENIITKLPELYSLSRNLRASNKLPAPFLKKPLCTGDLLPACKIFIERPVQSLPLALKGIPHVKYEKKPIDNAHFFTFFTTWDLIWPKFCSKTTTTFLYLLICFG